MFTIILILLLSYLVGSIPTAIIVSRLAAGIDIRNYGSGNAGGTNVFRVLGWKYGILVMLFDAFKGVVAVVFIARLFFLTSIPFENPTPFDDFTFVQLLAGISAVIGHVFTVFAGFRGGKGMATAVGMTASLMTIDVLIAAGIFLLMLIKFRYVSLGSISAAIALPLILFIRENLFHVHIQGYTTLIAFSLFIAIFITYTHRSNIKRLIEGTESRIKRIPLIHKKAD
ncbi:MAG: glycerol-3-phosphate 1-O-acyltransferase PlsY [Ignavibacteria bacterium]